MTGSVTPYLSQGAEIADARLRDFIEIAGLVGPNGYPAIGTGDLAAMATELLAAREALAARIVPEGWKAVPVEPTPEMMKAYHEALRGLIGSPEFAEARLKANGRVGGIHVGGDAKAKARYQAMLAASPTANVPPQVNEAVAVKPLEWSDDDEDTDEPIADWVGGRYWVREDAGKFELRLEYVGGGSMYQTLLGAFDTLDAAKVAAQTDCEPRIMSDLASPSPGTATAGASDDAAQVARLVAFFNEPAAFSKWGNDGDHDLLVPADTAIRALRAVLATAGAPAASPAIPKQEGVEPVAEWRCAKCGCHSFARIDQLSDSPGRLFEPSDNVRCVNCKDVSLYLAPSTAGRVERLETALSDVAAERERQKSVEGWTEAHDDEHSDRSLAKVASLYADPSPEIITPGWPAQAKPMPKGWPASWGERWWKPTDRRRDLVKAGALIVAEIERLDRQALRGDRS